MNNVRRLQISIDEQLDEILAAEALRRRTSRAAIIRDLVRDALGPAESRDSMASLIGDIDDEAGDIDKVVYGS